jgi:hypothetical protein
MWCINARTYAHTYTYTYTHGCLLIHTHTYTHTYIFTHGCLLIHTHTHTYKGKHEQLDELLTELEGPTLKVVQCSVYAWFTHITHIYTHTHTHPHTLLIFTHTHTHRARCRTSGACLWIHLMPRSPPSTPPWAQMVSSTSHA